MMLSNESSSSAFDTGGTSMTDVGGSNRTDRTQEHNHDTGGTSRRVHNQRTI